MIAVRNNFVQHTLYEVIRVWKAYPGVVFPLFGKMSGYPGRLISFPGQLLGKAEGVMGRPSTLISCPIMSLGNKPDDHKDHVRISVILYEEKKGPNPKI